MCNKLDHVYPYNNHFLANVLLSGRVRDRTTTTMGKANNPGTTHGSLSYKWVTNMNVKVEKQWPSQHSNDNLQSENEV